MTRIESRLFRTWQTEREVDTPAWRTIFKYGAIRMFKTWYMAIALVLATVFVVVSVGAFSYSSGLEGRGVDHWDLTAAIGIFGIPLTGLFFVIGSGLVAEDLRFRAPLFYFARPVGITQYMLGKLSQLAALVATFGIVPILIVMVTATIAGLAGEPLDYRGVPLTGRALAEWQHENLDTGADWAYAWANVVPAILAISIFGISLFGFATSMVQRGWHAAMAVVAVLLGWGLVAAPASSALNNISEQLLHPFGWMSLVLMAPFEVRFGYRSSPFAGPSPYYDNAWASILGAHGLLWLASGLLLLATYQRLRRMEGAL